MPDVALIMDAVSVNNREVDLPPSMGPALGLLERLFTEPGLHSDTGGSTSCDLSV